MSDLEDLLLSQTGAPLAAFLAPVPGDRPTGENLYYSETYRRIRAARTEDNPNIPKIHEEEEFRTADWPLCRRLCVEALTGRSKDLQLAAWLLEADLAGLGLDGLAPALLLMERLAAGFWADLYPPIATGAAGGSDYEHRDNLFKWLDGRIPQIVYRLPVNADTRHPLSWQTLQAAANGQASTEDDDADGSDSDAEQLLAETASDHLIAQLQAVESALEQWEALHATLVGLRGDDQPSAHQTQEFLEAVGRFLYETLKRRGVQFEEPQPDGSYAAAADAQPYPADAAGDPAKDSARAAAAPDPSRPQGIPLLGGGVSAEEILDSRARAYAHLAEIGQFLSRIDPHSPVPVMLRQMVRWGRMDAGALYHEIFVEGGGKVDITKMMGMRSET